MTWGAEKGRELPPNWESEIVPAVKLRDGGRCRWVLDKSKTRCPRKGTDVDHIGDPDNHSLRNLRLLCRFHHDKRTAKQGFFAREQRKAKKLRSGEEHPNR
jgi:5-methylcytosine-specific restriction protein A